jgi:CBS domain-containing protein
MADITTGSNGGANATAAEVLKEKGGKVHTVGPEQSILDATKALAEHGVGSLLVVGESDRIVGILSERDILRATAKNFDAMGQFKVADLMSHDVIIALAEDRLDYLMCLMTEKRIRHLPIMSEGKLAGILSIGDVVKARAKHAEVAARHLADYITGQYPG